MSKRPEKKDDTENARLDAEIVDVDELDRLARLKPLEYDRERTDAAQRLGVRASVLDAEIKKRRQGDGIDLQGYELVLDDPEPWPESVDGTALLDSLTLSASNYLMLADGAAETIALWALHTHCHATAYHTPRLYITAPTKGCGKTTVLDWLSVISPRSIASESVTTAVLFRIADSHKPTLLVDEVNRTLANNSELIAAFNAGHKKGGKHLRCEGDNNAVRAFNTFVPVALAGIGRLPAPELADRSIPVSMRRATKRQAAKLRPFRSDQADAEQVLCRKAARWAADHASALAGHDPEMPDGMFNRVADNWRILFSIADLVGGHWPETARSIARKSTAAIDDDEAAIMLMQDMGAIFDAKGVEVLKSEEAVEALAKMEHRPWPEWGKNQRPITTRQLAKLLAPFEIAPGQHFKGGVNRRGYYIDQFQDAFQRYGVPREAALSAMPLEPFVRTNFSDSLPLGADQDLADKNVKKPQKPNVSSGIADRKGGAGDVSPSEEDRRVAFAERAAIVEFDGGFTREDAEAQAANDLEIPAFLRRSA